MKPHEPDRIGPPTHPVEFTVPRSATGIRIDRLVAERLQVSRAEAKRWISRGRVTVGGVVLHASSTLKEGARLVVLPEPRPLTAATPDAAVSFAVLHVDDDLVVVDKPPGLVVHPAAGHPSGTLVNGLLALGLFRADEVSLGDPGGHDRPGIVHRLDKGTSGVMVIARTPDAREALKAQFQAHSIERAYLAVIVGEGRDGTVSTLHGRSPKDRLRFTGRVARGKRAVTHVRVLEPLVGATLLECTLETGRTHQIRVHLSEGGTPILGDPLYGRPPSTSRVREIGERLGHQALHARLLGFVHPRTRARLRFETPPPADFLAALEALRTPR